MGAAYAVVDEYRRADCQAGHYAGTVLYYQPGNGAKRSVYAEYGGRVFRGSFNGAE